MSIKSSHKDLEGSCSSLDQVLSVAAITVSLNHHQSIIVIFMQWSDSS